MDIIDSKDGYEYLEMLRQQNQKQTQNFNDFSRYLETRARQQGIPLIGQFELTPLCNLSCKMCYVHLSADQLSGRSLLTVDQWKDLMRQAYEAGMFTATLTGGECLTYPGFEELYLYLQSLGCPVDIMTNGFLLDEKRVEFFQKHPPCSIQITLYGNDEDSYERVTGCRAFHKVLDNIHRVKNAELPLMISITPNRFLGEDVFDTIRTAWSLTKNVFVNTSLFSPPDEPWRLDPDTDPDAEFYARIRRYLKELQGFEVKELTKDKLPVPGGQCHDCVEHGLKCGGGRSSFVINWKGELLICNRMEPKSFPLSEGFSKAWQDIHEIAENWPRIKECQGCAYEDICGICTAEALKYARPGERPITLCRQTTYMASKGVLNLQDCK